MKKHHALRRAIALFSVCSLCCALAGCVRTAAKTDGEKTTGSDLVIADIPSCYERSSVATVTANGKDVPLIRFVTDYDHCGFSFSGKVEICVTVKEPIQTFTVSPLAKNISATASGNTLTFTLEQSAYLIVKINSLKEIVIAADPLETDVPDVADADVYSVTDYGADKTGTTLSTSAVQGAIHAASAAGGGTVFIPEGVYLVGNIELKSNVNVYLAPGCVLRSTGDYRDYTKHFAKKNLGLVADGTWFLSGQNVSNVRLYGRGILDARGDYMRNDCGTKYLSDVLFLQQCSHITVDGLTLRDGGFWGTLILRSDNITLRNTKHFQANAYGNNRNHENDALDIVECQHVNVTHSIGISEDDSYSTKCYVLNGLDINENWLGSTETIDDVTFDDCFGWSRCGTFKVGWGVGADQTNVTFKNSYSYQSMFAIGIMVNSGLGTSVKNITFENIDIEGFKPRQGDAGRWLDFCITSGSNPGNIKVSDVTVKNVVVRAAGSANSRIQGRSNDYRFDGVTLENIYMNGSDTPADSLAAMNIVSSNSTNIKVLPEKEPGDEPVNLALNKTGWSKYFNPNDADKYGGDISWKALDGIVSNDSRWGTPTNSCWDAETQQTLSGNAWKAVRPTQFFAVDLGDVVTFDKIVINWETAYAKEYKLLVSDDKETWTEIAHITDGRAGVREHVFDTPMKARYVKMQGISEGTTYGYSIYEFEVYNTSPRLAGDVDLDGSVGASDLTALARHVAGIELITAEAALANAELDGVSGIGADDLTLLARKVAGID